MGTDKCNCVTGMVCEQDMDRMFVLLEIEFRHQIGANSVYISAWALNEKWMRICS